MPDREDANDVMPHQDLLEDVASDVVASEVQPDDLHIANATTNVAAAAGANPTKAEYDALVTAHNALATSFNALVDKLESIDVLASS